MSNAIQMKKSELLAILESTEDEKLINFTYALIRGYLDQSTMQVTETQNASELGGC